MVDSGLTCVILAGGLGTRLRSVLPDTPKPMAAVDGRPFLEYLLAQVCQAGLTDVVLCVGHKAEVIENHVADGRKYGLRIRYSRERELLGTAGALSQATNLIQSDPFLVANGDSYCDVEIHELLKEHQTRDAVATIVVNWVEDQSRYGGAVLGPEDTVVRFAEKTISGPGYINGGIYVLKRAVLDLVPPGQYCSIEHDVFPLLAGHGLYAFKTSGTFIDIGTPAELERARRLLKDVAGGKLRRWRQ